MFRIRGNNIRNQIVGFFVSVQYSNVLLGITKKVIIIFKEDWNEVKLVEIAYD